MFTFGMLLFDIGVLTMFITAVWFLIVAFRQSPSWGLAVLFVPFLGGVFFLYRYWDVAKKPFAYQMLGFLLFFIGNTLARPEW